MDLPATILAGSYFESAARERLAGLLDVGSFAEILPPPERCRSPHLAAFGIAAAFDDGIVIGRGRLDGRPVLAAAQEGAFLGGTFGEVHGAKLVGLLRGAVAAAEPPAAILLLLDTGGVRLQEANAGEIAVGDVILAVLAARAAGIPVVALLGGRSGCFGGGSLVAACCSGRAISEAGRLGVSGPEVIETAFGVEEFDARDRPLVWRIVGGRTRFLLGGADLYVDETIPAFRAAALTLIAEAPAFDAAALARQTQDYAAQAAALHGARDATEIWRAFGLPPDTNDLPDEAFRAAAADHLRLAAKSAAAAATVGTEAFALGTLAHGALEWQNDCRITPHGVLAGTVRTGGGGVIGVIGLVGEAPLGVEACVTLSREVAAITEDAPERPILILVDTVGQRMSRSDELLGLNQAIGNLAQSIVLARRRGHRVVSLLLGKAAAAAFIALVLMAERVVALPEAAPAVLSLAAVARVTKMPLAELERLSETMPVLSPGLEPMRQLGAVQEVLAAGPALTARLEELLLAKTLEAPPEPRAAQPYRDLVARVQTLVAGV